MLNRAVWRSAGAGPACRTLIQTISDHVLASSQDW